MPNIHIVGFDQEVAEKMRERIDSQMAAYGVASDSITTIIAATTRCCHMDRFAPYLAVWHTDIDAAKLIATDLRHCFLVDVEYHQIAGFLSADEPIPRG